MHTITVGKMIKVSLITVTLGYRTVSHNRLLAIAARFSDSELDVILLAAAKRTLKNSLTVTRC